MDSESEIRFILHKIKSLDPHVFWNDSFRIQKCLWKTFSETLVSLLTLTMEMVTSNESSTTPTSTIVIKMMSTSTILLSVVRTMMALAFPVPVDSSRHQNNDNNQAWNESDWPIDALFRGNFIPPPQGSQSASLASLVELDMNMISRSIAKVKECIMNNMIPEKYPYDLDCHQLSHRLKAMKDAPYFDWIAGLSLTNSIIIQNHQLSNPTPKKMNDTTLNPRSHIMNEKSGQLQKSLLTNSENHQQQQQPVPSKSTTPSVKSGKSIKIFFSNQGRGSLSKSSSTTSKIRGGLKGFFHLSTTKHETKSNRSSIASVSTNNSSTVGFIQDQNSSSTKQQSLKSTSSHDSLLLPLPSKPAKDSSPTQWDSNTTSNAFTDLSNPQEEDSINTKLATSHTKQRNRTSVQLLVSPTTKNTDIRMFYDQPLSLSMVPLEKQQKQHQSNALPSPPPSATLLETTSSSNRWHLSTVENSDLDKGRGRTCSLSNTTNSIYINTQRHSHHQRLTQQRSVSPTIVSIHTEHAEPTFIRTTTPSDTYHSTKLIASSSAEARCGRDRTPSQDTFNLTASSTSPKAMRPPTATGVTREHLLKVKNRQGLKSYRSDSDLGRLKSIFMPPTCNNNAKCYRKDTPTKPTTTCNPTTKSSTLFPPPLSHSSSLQSLSSILRPLVPQRTPSTRLIHKSSCLNIREMHDSQLPTISSNSGIKHDSSPWYLLRHVRKNSSTTSLKRSAASYMQENEHFTSYGPFAENTINSSSEGSVLHLSENGQDVLVMEMVAGRFQVVAGTCEKLFIKLADETTQDFSYVDAYVLNHADFTSSEEFLENLMARFHIEPQPGETDYFRKWQRCIQIKVLNIISRWIKLQYQDFMNSPILLVRLQAFINGDITRGGFMAEASNIKDLLQNQVLQHDKKRFSVIQTELHRSHHEQFQHHRSSPSPSQSPVVLSPPSSPVLSLGTKEMAQYLTLADFYLLKCITANEFLHGTWRKSKIQTRTRNAPHPRPKESHHEDDYIQLMTKRANMLGSWTKNEIRLQQLTKNRAVVLKKMVEIVNLCLEWNNFHTSMIIVASLLDPSIQKLSEWTVLSSRDLQGYQHVVKLLDVSNNMGNYRQVLGKAKSPTVPFFPLLLKDMTFFMDGNPTYLSSATVSTNTHPNLTASSSPSTELINFAKYRSMTRCVHGILCATSEDYYFATDLGPWPFLRQDIDPLTDYLSSTCTLPLDRTALLLEQWIWSTNNGLQDSSSVRHAGS